MRRVIVLAIALGLSGCQDKEQARALVSAVDAYRAASNEAKPAKAAELDAVKCTEDDVCKAKDVCRKSADATARGLTLQAEIQAAIKDGGPADPDATQKKFDEANSDLAEGFGFLEECRAKTQALRDKYGI